MKWKDVSVDIKTCPLVPAPGYIHVAIYMYMYKIMKQSV